MVQNGKWVNDAEKMQLCLTQLLPQEHGQSFRGSLKNCMAFRVNPGCQVQWLVRPSQLLHYSQGAQVQGKNPRESRRSERLLLSLLDMSEGLGRATVWPPLCSLDIWSEGSILTILGCSVSMQYSNVSIGSDSLAMPDTSQTLADFPEVIMSMNWVS